ncbi:MAG TPA: cupin domain-containing protein [Candidatus Dormibacteraeota bacterium]|nr:cupin domain-containing protein [Candidatus Dormibacteraeota bacterium]
MNKLHAGDRIENRVTGERLVFRETSHENGGRRVLFDTFVEPGGFVAAAHLHPFQVEQFEVVSGSLGLQLAHESLELGPGAEVAVLNGTPHRFWNAGEDELHFRVSISPALQFESLLTTMFALAEEGKTNGRGMPNPLRLAVIAQAHFDTVRLPSPPVFVQRLGLAVGAALGRLVGYKPAYSATAAVQDSQVA